MQLEERVKASVLRKSITDILPNLLFFGIGVPVIILLGSWFRWIGILGFAIYTLILFTDFFRLAIQVVTGIILLFGIGSTGGPNAKAQAISWVATLIQILETAIFTIYTIALYRALFA